jgi:glycerol-3-phosphate dehydrogenase subunit B
MSDRVFVIGGGFAGIAAAFAAREAGAEVVMSCGRGGAASFSPGAIDHFFWDELEAASELVTAKLVAAPLPVGARPLLDALDLYSVPDDGAPLPRLVTSLGVVRTARAFDRALCDLGALRGRRLLLPRADRPGWDADSLARVLADSSHVAGVEVVDCPVLRYDEETRVSDAELAERHDDPARLAWLAERLAREIQHRPDVPCAVLLGPWLGREAPRADELSARVGAPVGEALSATSGSAGARFEVARGRLLQRLGVTLVPGGVSAITRGRDLEVAVGSETFAVRAVVLATGGLVGGGLVYDPPEHRGGAEGAGDVAPPFRLNVKVPGARVTSTGDHGVVGSIEGPVLDQRTWPAGGAPGLLERAGVLVGPNGEIERTSNTGIFAAGDVTFGARRTALAAVASGLAAGRSAAARLASKRASEPALTPQGAAPRAEPARKVI